ncbi:amino acid permease [Rubrobacter taiwanensis]|uniref:Amino acid permease n=1 Tax=Rubrobacter taiwanensis TaxID=185139 RepID=A0A4R1BDX0_9ACTN|nr:APC family permease [Rubrobacter taiwanensis]TCJ15247.1 amino acid permease [Rubrobacter taiwanensis]
MREEERFIRVLGRRDVLLLAFGAMIGFGWVVLAGTWLQEAGSLGAILAFLLGGLLVVFVGLTYSELVSAMPRAGGEHNYAWRAIGPVGAFVASWAIALGYVSVCAFEAVALPTTVGYLLPEYEAVYLWTVADYDVYLSWAAVGVVGSVAIAALNYFGIRPSAIFQLIAVLFLLGVGVLLIFGTFVGGSTENFRPLFAGGVAGIIAVLIMTPFLFVGFDVIPQSAEEIDLPYRLIGALLVLSVVLATLWYVLIIVGVGAAMSRAELAETDLATADAMGALFGSQFFANLLVLGGVAGILTSWNAFMIGGSRILYAMAESGMLPRWLGRIHPRYRTPSNAILLIGALSVIAPFFGQSALVWFVNAGGLNIVVAYLLVAISFLVLRRNEPEMPRPFRAGRGPVVGIVAVLLSLGLAVQYLPGMPAGLVWPYEWVIVLLWWAAGIVFMFRMDVPEYSPEL